MTDVRDLRAEVSRLREALRESNDALKGLLDWYDEKQPRLRRAARRWVDSGGEDREASEEHQLLTVQKRRVYRRARSVLGVVDP